jgi:hypothetical protein
LNGVLGRWFLTADLADLADGERQMMAGEEEGLWGDGFWSGPFNRRWTRCTQMKKIRIWMGRMDKIRMENGLADAEATKTR